MAVSDRQKPEVCPLPGRFWVNILAQGVLRKWPWIEHPTFQLRGGNFTTELMPPQIDNSDAGHINVQDGPILSPCSKLYNPICIISEQQNYFWWTASNYFWIPLKMQQVSRSTTRHKPYILSYRASVA